MADCKQLDARREWDFVRRWITCASWFTSRLRRKVLKSTQLPISAGGLHDFSAAAKVHPKSTVIFQSPPAFLQYSRANHGNVGVRCDRTKSMPCNPLVSKDRTLCHRHS